MEFFVYYLKNRKKGIGVFFLFCMVFGAAFFLYHLPLGAVLYPAFVCGVLGLCSLGVDYYKAYHKHLRLKELKALPSSMIETLPKADSIIEADYQELLLGQKEEQTKLKNTMTMRYADMMDYYSAWAHQIKTPIASMRLHLQNEDSPLGRRVSEELVRIEQYVEMVMVFLRLDSDFTDYVIGEYDIDGILKQAVKKFSSQFIGKKLRLSYTPLNFKVTTDEKWLLFVIEQLLSNAVKYTPAEGCIFIEAKDEGALMIRDTGIGIDPQDLPRIFEKGYTGYNGRADKKASGIGLYLCRRICRNLGHEITAESRLDKGTCMKITFLPREAE